VIATVALVVIVVVGVAGVGWWFLQRSIWCGIADARGWSSWRPVGMMGGYLAGSGYCWPSNGTTGVTAGQILTIEQAKDAVENYIARLADGDLKVAEVMEFTRNFHAAVEEKDTGIGAMELLVDKDTGAVSPEPGPNMMWNAKYGMHRSGMGWVVGGGTSVVMRISAEEALNIAKRWLEVYRPGIAVESHADAFYGYYTIHTLRNGEISGMLSVHGDTGQVWYHNWHGDFVQMIGKEEEA